MFSGVERLYGKSNFEKISNASVLIIGIGGVGSWCAESLVRSGVKKVTLLDLDDICITNSNRQLHTTSKTIGQSKVSVMATRLREINPNLEVDSIEDFYTEENSDQILSKGFHVVVDAIDGLKNKSFLAGACFERNIPLVICGGAAGKRDVSKIQICDLGDTTQDMLLKRLRKKLRRNFGFEQGDAKFGILTVSSTERAQYPDENGNLCFRKDLKEKTNAKLDCQQGMGTSSFMTGAFGFAAAQAAIEQVIK